MDNSKSLTTLLSYPYRSNKYGNNKYRGNCPGELIRDLILFFNPKKVFDPMCGSGTTNDACKELNINNLCLDLNPAWGGFDLLNNEIPESSDLIFAHFPYHDMIKYSGNMWGNADTRDLSRCSTYEEFIRKINIVQAKLITSLRNDGRLIILIGDKRKNGSLNCIQKDMNWYGTPEHFIIKEQHNCWSDNRNYRGKIIPIKHEYLLVFKKSDCYVLPIKIVKNINYDLRQSKSMTWRDTILAAIQKLGGKATLKQLYSEVEGNAKTKNNANWREKIRQVVRTNKEFINIDRGIYQLASL